MCLNNFLFLDSEGNVLICNANTALDACALYAEHVHEKRAGDLETAHIYIYIYIEHLLLVPVELAPIYRISQH